ncbi:hypothetical protein [Salisediminibacterium selenitireducens]|uniref:DUF4367 domain-containing protein n=1 Tax=Bacillus selenitireducens (strain ATCC 700615 / DSM 15326 / MLS10) TaxID=439292 RepID=D6XVY7_BACIE|nr:hypothetical protein [Salisediminibacterium selenitireducens]ADH97760.1 hypothetical protein Bsel_0214 [[Bacillus] selenitireducens MLS10]
MNKRHDKHEQMDTTDKQLTDLMKNASVELPKQTEKASLNAMAKGVSEARQDAVKMNKWQERRTLLIGFGGTVSAAALAGLILINTDFVQDAFPGWFGDDAVPADENNEENEEEPDEHDEQEENDDEESSLDFTKPEFEVLPPEEDGEDDREVTFTYHGDSWNETFEAFSSDHLPIHGFRPEGWALNEETIEDEFVIDRLTIGDYIQLDYYELGATAEDMERSVQAYIDEHGFEDDEIETLPEDEIPELGQGLPFSFFKKGYRMLAEGDTYTEIYYGELNGRYVRILHESPDQEPELWAHGDVFFHLIAPVLPATVASENDTIDEETGRAQEKTIRFQLDDGIGERDFKLFNDDELGFNSYIPEDFAVQEERDGRVKQYILDEQEDPWGQVSIGIFDEDVTQDEAWTYILDHFAYGENIRDQGEQSRTPDWAIDTFDNHPGGGADIVGSAKLSERNGRYFYIEDHSESFEIAAFDNSITVRIIEHYWQWDDGSSLKE